MKSLSSILLLAFLLPAIAAFAAPDATNSSPLLEYNLKTSAGAYEKIGLKDPKWDATAKKVLGIFANMAATNGDYEAQSSELRRYLSQAPLTTCNDPLIRYLYVRYVFSQEHSATDTAGMLVDAAVGLQKSQYPYIRKFYAAMRARDMLVFSHSKNGEASKWLKTATESLAKALEEKTMPPQEADEACDMLMSEPSYALPIEWERYQTLEPVLTTNWAGASFALLTKGRAYLSYAWQARGTGFAGTVSDAGWKKMAERLDIAADALEAAWRANPKDERICLEMMRVEEGQGRGRERLDLWFQRGMQLNPSNYDLCSQKLEYLRPRWYGSAEEMIEFGRQCTMNTNYSGGVRLMLPDSYFEVAREIQDDAKRTAYWRQPAVWKDVKFSFDQFFKLYPNEVGYRHNYAYYAALCEKWQVFSDQIKLFPSTNYEYFGGSNEFDNLLHKMEVNLKKH